MSIVLKDGTVLPDLPEVFLSEYQYYAICSYDSVLEVAGAHFAIFANSPIIYVPVGITAHFEYPALISEQAGYVLLAFAPSETTEWEMASQSASSILTLYAPVENGDKFVWSNHDILTATSFEIASDFSSISVTTGEIYFPNSLAKPPFVLPDGTELPALPDGCFDGTPYGIISIFDDGDCSILTSQSPVYVEENEEGVPTIFLSVGKDISWYLVDGSWQFFFERENDTPLDWMSFAESPVKWSNHDIMHGTEIARKSDENYRVTGGYMTSIANEARRLGNMTGSMKPDVVESTLRGVEAGGGSGGLPTGEVSGNGEIRAGAYAASEITKASFPNATLIDVATFYKCASLTSVDAPSAQYIATYGLSETAIKQANFPAVIAADYCAFQACTELEAINMPLLQYLGDYVFYECNKLVNVTLPALVEMGDYCFQSLENLETVELQNAYNLRGFSYCKKLRTVIAPAAEMVNSGAFFACSSLTKLDIVGSRFIDSIAFADCDAFETLILRSRTAVCELRNADAFSQGCPIGSGAGYIYVPSALVNSYKAATNWKTYASKIRAIEDYPDICGA